MKTSNPRYSIPALLMTVGLLFLAGCMPPSEVTVHYLGHAAFVLKFGDGTTVLTDFGESNAYGLESPIFTLGETVPDVLTLSHEHADHAGGQAPPGIGTVLDGGEIFRSGGLTITPIPTYEKDLIRPDNHSFLFEYRGLKILHLGDCQALMVALRGGSLGPEGGRLDLEGAGALIREIYPDTYDLVLIPIGSTEDIVPEAAEFAGFLNARAIVPMHFWSLAAQEAFVERMGGRVDRAGRSYDSRLTGGAEITITHGTEPFEEVKVFGLTPEPLIP